MQVKLLISTAAVMLVMLLLSFVVLTETGRMKAFAAAADGRALERGAVIYNTYCASCHGENGTAVRCFDRNGNRIECAGVGLNSYFLLCGEPPRKLVDLGFTGTTYQYIAQMTAIGNVTSNMPAFANESGGPLSEDQIQEVTAYILNWNQDTVECPNFDRGELIWPLVVEDFLALEIDETVNLKIEPGDAEWGRQVYELTGCNACHGLLDDSGSNTVGPWLGNLKETGGSRIEGVSAAQYVYESILDPNAFIAPDCPFGPCPEPSLMPATYVTTFWRDPQELADLLAYLLGAENLPGAPEPPPQ